MVEPELTLKPHLLATILGPKKENKKYNNVI